MGRESYVQMTVKFPMGKERYRQAVECISGRYTGAFRTQADYITAAVLYFEGRLSDERISLNQILDKLQEMEDILEEIRDGRDEE